MDDLRGAAQELARAAFDLAHNGNDMPPRFLAPLQDQVKELCLTVDRLLDAQRPTTTHEPNNDV